MNTPSTSSPDVDITAARAEDRTQVLDLLERNALPTAGLHDHWDAALVARRHGRVVGAAALEIYADGALLRSVAVEPALQRSGVGRRLTEAALQLARDRGVAAVYLLTTTAERYFPAFGFEPIDRQSVPESVKTSVEFTSACPASAVVMRKRL